MAASDLWPTLCREMAAGNAPWSPLTRALAEQHKNASPVFVVLPLDRPAALLATPDAETRLQDQGILAPAEAERLRSLKLPKRRHEWLGGRLAAKWAITRLLGWDDIPAIANDEQGQPFAELLGPHAQTLSVPVHVSISHSGAFAAALAAHVHCGLDVQALSPQLAEVQSYFLTAAEAVLAPALEELPWLALVWTAKEAVKKCRYAHSATFMERIRVRALEGDPRAGAAVLRCCLAEGGELAPLVMLGQGHALALCLEDETKTPLRLQKDTQTSTRGLPLLP